jgi:hypothetical protein
VTPNAPGPRAEEAFNSREEATDTEEVSEQPELPALPAVHDLVEIVDRVSDVRVTAIVESANGGQYVLRLDRAASVPEMAPVRWYEGDIAWQAIARLEKLGETRVTCRLAPAHEWMRSPGRQALRTPVDNAPVIVRIISSTAAVEGRQVHALCVDISDSGFRVTSRRRCCRGGVGHGSVARRAAGGLGACERCPRR